MPTLTLASCFLALSSAFLLYGLANETRRVERRVQEAERVAERTRAEISVLRAERAHLARPERIEPIARKHGLRPSAPEQFEGRLDSSPALVDLRR